MCPLICDAGDSRVAGVLLSSSGAPHLFKASLHFLQDFRGVADHQLDRTLGGFQQLHGLLVVLPLHALQAHTRVSDHVLWGQRSAGHHSNVLYTLLCTFFLT